ncbi:MAG: BamA/TamA family outer membrane protein [Gemmatimonadetes bacterium]|nr:BamA/TamA family outer membrane protein [Gemmatimonadota bacterium]
MKTAAVLAALLMLTARLGLAQRSGPWVFYLFPVPTYNSLEGLAVSITGGWRKAPSPGPIPVGISIEPTAWISTSGTRGIQLTLDYSGRWPGWRFLAIGGAQRGRRAPFYGIGNATVVNDSLEEANGGIAHYYRYSLVRTTGLAAIRRRITGPLHVQVGGQWRHYAARTLDGQPTALGDTIAAGFTRSDTGSATSVELRGGLLFDTRDEEASPSRGIFLEALAARGLDGAGDFAYTRWAFGAREFIPVGTLTTLALRQSVELADGHLPFYIAYERLTAWRPEDGFGGPTTLRANRPGRWIGPNKALASVDLRYRRWDASFAGSPFRLWLIAFADLGRVWSEDERFRARELHSGYGAGFRFQLSKGSLFGMDFGWSPDAHFEFGSALTMAF